MKKALLISLLAALCWLGTLTYGHTQVGDIRLEARVRRLEQQVRQVRSQLIQESSQRPVSPTSRPASPASSLEDSPLEAQFDNLATLAIELKQQVRTLEARVLQLEEALQQPEQD